MVVSSATLTMVFVGWMGGAVMSEKGEEEGAEDTTLWCTCVQDESGGSVFSHSDVLRSVAQDVQYPCT